MKEYTLIPYDTARVIEVVETTLKRAGDGIKSPIRVLTQYWTLDGQLLASVDPCEKMLEGMSATEAEEALKRQCR